MPSGITVVEIEIPDHRRIDKGCGLRWQPVPKTEYVARILARDLTGCQSPANLRRLTVVGAKRTAKRIDQSLRRGMHALLGQVVELRGRRVFSYFVGDAIHFMCSVTWSW